ncbi:hypothetical protein N7510_003894 [Penicillium lagena]|uniref:uncharacterized protein n=1 Tax=Penicillium lagena TaxID=94218 RepID=UPI0025409C24|nr:uncharacterized protein N7510_003894 [Penicillium lagena]KAJ5619910.1 hypothetical protein N7510_003894 [Penicillium lagena]
MSGCISLSGSTTCPAWDSASISTNPSLYGDFPFLENVSTLSQFDQALSSYLAGSYVTSKYVDLLGCEGLNSSALNDYYARYTTSVVCSGLVQSSKGYCGLTSDQSPPLCADTCALQAMGEQEIIVNSKLCTGTDKDYMSQIKADLAVCTGPLKSLTGSCVEGYANQQKNCGYASNTIGLCTYCKSTNSSDSCCADANAGTRCQGVTIPTSTATLQPLNPSSSATSTAAAATAGGSGLSGGAIAGIVIGSVAAAAILCILIFFLWLCYRRRRRSQNDSGLNQPNPQRRGTPPMHMQQPDSPKGYNMVPGGRVTRMSALREIPSSSPAYSRTSGAMFGAAKYSDSSDSEAFGASPGAMSKRIPPVTGRRHGSLSSNSVLAGLESDSSPRSGTATATTGNQYSSPEAVTSGQSEQLSYFRDYYSQDDIHPGDQVAVLWAYAPRAGDEFELDRGEMLKVIGIWDDGWATGVRLTERAEDYDVHHREQRDSGVSNGSQQRTGPSPAPSGEIKAFPLVCICLPQHWHKIIDGTPQEDEA